MDRLVRLSPGCFLVSDRIKAVFDAESGIVKSLKKAAQESNLVIDLSFGKKTRAVVLMDSGHVILSPVSKNRIMKKIQGGMQR
ncbi:MAG: hypothetical protein PWP37_247 [Thermotogota bacterium]|nr:hypothetical protein [Thermotogota bacterium]MDK2864055.1 hypothetical protein [Thermotogota bacterium]